VLDLQVFLEVLDSCKGTGRPSAGFALHLGYIFKVKTEPSITEVVILEFFPDFNLLSKQQVCH
jgi:hypothetical protein